MSDATTREIARRAGQNISTIAYHFGNKEGLYAAVIAYINAIILRRYAKLFDEIDAFLAGPKHPPARCLDLFGQLLSNSAATHREVLAVSSIIVREQSHPTKAFAVLFDGSLKRLQRAGSDLIDVYTQHPRGSEETTVRFHAILGQSLVFRNARATIMRGLGWQEVGEREEQLIERVVVEQALDVLRALRVRRSKQKKA